MRSAQLSDRDAAAPRASAASAGPGSVPESATMKRIGLLLLLSVAAVPTATGTEPERFEWTAMGTRMRILVRGCDAEAGRAAFVAAKAAVEAVEAETSAFRPTSCVSRLAAAAGSGEWTAVGPEFEAALDVALEVWTRSGGAFNPLVAPVMAVNGFPRGAAAPSSAAELLDVSAISRRPGECRLERPGMALDLGGVAKGLGADRAAAAAGAATDCDFLIDAGGNLIGRGSWSVGVRDPRAAADAPPLRTFVLPDGAAVSTSGNYERFTSHPNGAKTGHLFDPRTGQPADGGALQATAIAPTAAEADAWSTALFILGPEAGRATLGPGNPVAALWVLPSGALVR